MCWKPLQRPAISAQQNAKTRQATTDYIVPDLIDFFGCDWKRDQNILKKEILIFVKNIVLTKNWFVVSNLCEFPKHDTEKWGSGHLYFLLKTKVKFTTFRTFYLQSK